VNRIFRVAVVVCTIATTCYPASAAERDYPDATLTPGRIQTKYTQDQICTGGFSKIIRAELSPADWNARRAEVYRRYRVRDARGANEVDHLVSLELGGANDVRNLWPQPTKGQKWNSFVKDHLENRFRGMVCNEGFPLAAAQHAIATDWIAAYREYVSPEPQGEDGHFDPSQFEH
jgi:hypothetical protein